MATKKKNPASRPGAFQLRKGTKIRNINDPEDFVARNIIDRTARIEARRLKALKAAKKKARSKK